MRIPEFKQLIINRYFTDTKIRTRIPSWRRISLLGLGKPGIGKTVAAREASHEIARRLKRDPVEYTDDFGIKIATGQEDPSKYYVYHEIPLVSHDATDLTGRPGNRQVTNTLAVAVYNPYLFQLVFTQVAGMIVLDDCLDIKDPEKKSALYRVTLDRVFGYWRLHPDVMVVALSNTPEHSSLSEAMPTPQATRFQIHHLDEPTLDEWHAWMSASYGDHWDKTTYTFNQRFSAEGVFCRIPEDPETLFPYPTPRSWTAEAVSSYFGASDPIGFLGPEIGEKYLAFKRTEVNVEELVANPSRWDELELDSKYIAIQMLASFLGRPEAVPSAIPLVDTITSDSAEYFALLLKVVGLKARTKLLLALSEHDKKYRTLTKEILGDAVAIKRGVGE